MKEDHVITNKYVKPAILLLVLIICSVTVTLLEGQNYWMTKKKKEYSTWLIFTYKDDKDDKPLKCFKCNELVKILIEPEMRCFKYDSTGKIKELVL